MRTRWLAFSKITRGSFGAIFYWLGQQDVRRGDQPWFYYLLLMPQYDPVAVFVGLGASIFVV